MEIVILEAQMFRDADGYVGTVRFEAKGHSQPYELTLHSKSGEDWGYSLLFYGKSGVESEIMAVEERLEEDDELFDKLVGAALESMNPEPS